MSTDNANSVYIELLKASEKYCDEHYLTVAEDLITLPDKLETNSIDECSCDGINDEDLETLVEYMKEAAYYEAVYDEKTNEIVHHAFAYCFDCNPTAFLIKVYDQERKSVSACLTDDEFNDYFKNVTVERLKKFKYLQSNQEETEND